MAWTDLTRLKMKGALDYAYLNGLKDNLEYLKTQLSVSHDDFGHGMSTDAGSSSYGAYPLALGVIEYDSGYSVNWGLSEIGTVSINSSGSGYVELIWPVTYAFSAVDDFAIFACPINSPSEGEPLVSRCAKADQGTGSTPGRTAFVRLHGWGVQPTDASALVDSSFFYAIFGKNAGLPATWASWREVPTLLDGFPVPTDWFEDLFKNYGLYETAFTTQHAGYNGVHISPFVPSSGGALTYRRELYSDDQQSWIVEPWSYGVDKFEQIENNYEQDYFSGGSANTQYRARLASLQQGGPIATALEYGCLATMNPYAIADTRMRTIHPMQYRDGVLFAPRMTEQNPSAATTGEHLWRDYDGSDQGAPGSFAFLRFNKSTELEPQFAGGDRLAGFDQIDSHADGYQESLLLLTEMAEELEEYRRLFEVQHNTSNGRHETKPPGVYGVGRVVYTFGGSPLYAAESWSTGISGTTDITSTVLGCRLTFDATFNDFRSFGVIVTADDTGTAASAHSVPIVERNSNGTTADVHIYRHDGSLLPASRHSTFNYLIIGVR